MNKTQMAVLVRWCKQKLISGYKHFSVLPDDEKYSDTEQLLKSCSDEYSNWTSDRHSIQDSTAANTSINPSYLEDLGCGLSVNENQATPRNNRQEFSFTLYDFDGHGKITKDDIAGLVTTIYETVGSSIRVPQYGSKTIKVKLTVSPGTSVRDSTVESGKSATESSGLGCCSAHTVESNNNHSSVRDSTVESGKSATESSGLGCCSAHTVESNNNDSSVRDSTVESGKSATESSGLGCCSAHTVESNNNHSSVRDSALESGRSATESSGLGCCSAHTVESNNNDSSVRDSTVESGKSATESSGLGCCSAHTVESNNNHSSVRDSALESGRSATESFDLGCSSSHTVESNNNDSSVRDSALESVKSATESSGLGCSSAHIVDSNHNHSNVRDSALESGTSGRSTTESGLGCVHTIDINHNDRRESRRVNIQGKRGRRHSERMVSGNDRGRRDSPASSAGTDERNGRLSDIEDTQTHPTLSPFIFHHQTNLKSGLRSNCGCCGRTKKRSSSLQRQELLKIIQANMEKNNLSFQSTRKHNLWNDESKDKSSASNFPYLSKTKNHCTSASQSTVPPSLANHSAHQTAPHIPHVSKSTAHQHKHRNREAEQARAMAQVVKWLEQEFSSQTKCSGATTNGQKTSNGDNSKSATSQPHEHHHLHEHIHHHYHYYYESPVAV